MCTTTYTPGRPKPWKWSRRSCIAGVTALGAAVAASATHAQPPPAAAANTLNAEQRAGIEQAVRANPQVQSVFRGGQQTRVTIGDPEMDKAEAQAFLSGERSQPPSTRVTVLVLDPTSKTARRVVVLPSENNRVAAVEQVTPTVVPFMEDDLTAAWTLA